MLKVFSKCLLLVFPVLSSRNSVSKRSQILDLRSRTCTTFSRHNIPALKNWEKKWLSLEKTFPTANLDNYSNKILLCPLLSIYHLDPSQQLSLISKPLKCTRSNGTGNIPRQKAKKIKALTFTGVLSKVQEYYVRFGWGGNKKFDLFRIYSSIYQRNFKHKCLT